MEQTAVSIKTLTLKKEMKYEGKALLTYQLDYPRFESPRYQLSLMWINRYYEKKTRDYQKYLEKELFPQAVELYKTAMDKGYPAPSYQAMVTFKMTENKGCIVSLYSDQYEYTGGAHGNTVRSAQTWNLQKRELLHLHRLLPCGPESKKEILSRIFGQIHKNPSIYFDNYKKLVEENWKQKNFYCTPRGLVVFFPLYTIAPYVSGIREFMIPYSDCVRNPQKTCFLK